MATVADIIANKLADVVTVDGRSTVLEATKLMNRMHIGSVLVPGEDGSIAGILTERDLLTRIVAAERDPATTLVRDVMTREVVCCDRGTSVEELRELFRSRRIRHLPVRDHAGVCAMVSIGDINAWDADQLAATVTSLTAYITQA